MILPSIDLMGGKAVQLVGGDPERVGAAVGDVFALADEFARFGMFQVIDLDRAFGKGKDNLPIVRELCRRYDVRVGGGIRSVKAAKDLVRCGAREIIIGTQANPEFLSTLCREIGKRRIIVALDARKGKVESCGWTKTTGKDVFSKASELSEYCSGFLYTCIDKEGRMGGCDLDTASKLTKITNSKISYAGGVSSIEDIQKFEDIGIDSVLGMALYTGRLKLDDIFVSRVNFSRNAGLVPVVAQDIYSRDVLMVAYMDKDALVKTLKSGKMTYYSRSKKKQWMKGETSGNTQELVSIKLDCDRDTILAVVKQKGVACHSGTYSCFGYENSKESNILTAVYNIISDRIKNPKENSYTSRIAEKKDSILRKINEESMEVIIASKEGKREEIIWEISDLVYFLLVLAAANKIDLRDIWNMLDSRQKE